MVNTRAEAFATRFETANAAVIAAVTECSDTQWRQRCASEGWSVGVVAHHIAVVYLPFAEILRALAGGGTLSPSVSIADVHRSNAQHALDYAAVSKQETLDTLRMHGDTITQLLRSLDDGQLDNPAGIFGEHELRVSQVAEWVVLGHTTEHLASLRATLAA